MQTKQELENGRACSDYDRLSLFLRNSRKDPDICAKVSG